MVIKKTSLFIVILFLFLPISYAYEISYYHNNHLGSPAVITNQQGERVYTVDYKPFGQSFNEDFNEEGENRLKYNTKEQDDTGLHYYGARYYDSDLGRFISVDPIGGSNVYVYTRNNPLMYIDPSGGYRWFVGDFLNRARSVGVTLDMLLEHPALKKMGGKTPFVFKTPKNQEELDWVKGRGGSKSNVIARAWESKGGNPLTIFRTISFSWPGEVLSLIGHEGGHMLHSASGVSNDLLSDLDNAIWLDDFGLGDDEKKELLTAAYSAAEEGRTVIENIGYLNTLLINGDITPQEYQWLVEDERQYMFNEGGNLEERLQELEKTNPEKAKEIRGIVNNYLDGATGNNEIISGLQDTPSLTTSEYRSEDITYRTCWGRCDK